MIIVSIGGLIVGALLIVFPREIQRSLIEHSHLMGSLYQGRQFIFACVITGIGLVLVSFWAIAGFT